jgi:hypothetical protein
MPYIYPQPIQAPFGPFEHVPMVAKSDEAIASSRIRHVTVNGGGEAIALVEASKLVGTTKCVLYLGDKVTTHFNNGQDWSKGLFKNARDIEPFWFCPGVDEPRIGWKTRSNDQIEKAVVEVYAAGLIEPISRKEIPVADLDKDPVIPAKGEKDEKKRKVTGSKPFSEVLEFVDPHKDLFPDKLLTVAHSPYQVRLNITRKAGSTAELYPSVSWTFLHVLADRKIDLTWGEDGQVPADQRDDVDAFFRGDIRNRELEVLGALRDKAITVDQDIVLKAIYHSGPNGKNGEPTPERGNFAALTLIWGNGPRIPVKAQAWALKADGNRATEAESAKVLGQVQFLWDWSEGPGNRPENWLIPRSPGRIGHGGIQQRALSALVTVVEPDGQPHGAINCPKRFGGKRGDKDKPIFPKQAPGSNLGFVVDPIGAGRTWASESKPGDGDRRAQTGAIFQPSCFPGDRYQIHVYLLGAADGTDLREIRGVNDAAGPLSDEIEGVGAGERYPHGRSGIFTVFRKAKVTFIEVRCPVPDDSLALVKATYEKLANTKIEVAKQQILDGAMSDARYQNLVRSRVDRETELKFMYHGATSKQQPLRLGATLFDVLSYPEWLRLLAGRRLVSFAAFTAKLEAKTEVKLEGGRVLAVLRTRPFVAATSAHRRHVKTLVPKQRDREEGDLREVLQYDCLLLQGNPIQEDLQIQFEMLPGGIPIGTPPPRIFATRSVSYCKVERRVVPRPAHPSHEIIVALPSSNAPNPEVTINYAAGKLGNRSRSVPRAGKDALAQLFTSCINSYQPADSSRTFVVEIRATVDPDSERDTVRLRRLNQCIDEQLARLVIGDVVTSQTDISEWTYQNGVTKFLKNASIPENGVFETIADQDYAGVAEGIIYFYLERTWSGAVAPTGASLTGSGTHRRPIAYQQNLFGGVASRQAYYGPVALLAHELGHCFFREHAAAKQWSFAYQPDPNRLGLDEESNHVADDGCVMNYDVDPTQEEFCARCILSLRGWRLERDPAKDFPVAVQVKQDEIRAETDQTVKAWRLLGLARYVKDRDRAQAVTYIDQAVEAWELSRAGWTSGQAINILRAAIDGYVRMQRPESAEPLMQKLLSASSHPLDTTGFSGQFNVEDVLCSVQILEGGETQTAPEGSYQYVNLTRDEKLVDGYEIPSIDRLGKRVRFKLKYTTAKTHKFKARLMAHSGNSAHAPGQLANQNIDKTQFVHVESEQQGKTNADGTVILEFDLPTDAGGDWFLLEVSDRYGTTIQSPAIVTMRALFIVQVVAEGTAAGFVFADNQQARLARFRELADQAYLPHGVYLIPVGQVVLTGHPQGNWVDGTSGLVPLPGKEFQAHVIRQTRAKPCGFGQVGTYERLEPHLMYVCFGDQVLAGFGLYDTRNPDVPRNPETPDVDPFLVNLTAGNEWTSPRVAAVYCKRQFAPVSSYLWTKFQDDSFFPPNLPDLTFAVPGDDRERNAWLASGNNNPDKKWFVKITATITASNEDADLRPNPRTYDISIDDAQGDPDPPALGFPGRCSKIKINLANLKAAFPRATQARIQVQALVAAPAGGLAVNGGHPCVVVVSTRKSFHGAGRSIEDQVSIMIHEIGHQIGMAPRDPPGTAEEDKHYYSRNGDHCKTGLPVDPTVNANRPDFEVDVGGQQKKLRQIAECVMYEAVCDPAKHVFCDACGTYVRERDWNPGLPAGNPL